MSELRTLMLELQSENQRLRAEVKKGKENSGNSMVNLSTGISGYQTSASKIYAR